LEYNKRESIAKWLRKGKGGGASEKLFKPALFLNISNSRGLKVDSGL
jgi:hypothetical protein